MRPKEYIEYEGISYSQLSRLASDPSLYKAGEEKEEGEDSDK